MVFVHSEKVPTTYREVSKIIKQVTESGRGLKNFIYENDKKFNRSSQRCLALISKIFEKERHIDHILNTTEILSKEPLLNPCLARVLIHELVWRKDLEYPCKPVQTVLKYKKEIQDAAASFEEEPIKKETIVKPRYIRINTMKNSVQSVIDTLRMENLTLIPQSHETYNEYLEGLYSLPSNHFMVDYHFKDMLVFGKDFMFFYHDYYKDGTFILQDKASCLPPFLLNPPKGSVVLDMCAAPGMKTIHYANLVGPKGRVYAVERNAERYKTLCQMVESHGLKNVQCMNRDASNIKELDFENVEYIGIDPSCSGSGMVDRINYKKSEDRLRNLVKFQEMILHRALVNFPNVKRVVYSTCSIHPEENEEVISKVLSYVNDFQIVNLQEKMGKNWNNFGSEKYGNIGTSCLYARPEKDLTNGFFVAVLERTSNRPQKSKKKQEKMEKNYGNWTEQPKVIKKENNDTDSIINNENTVKTDGKTKKKHKKEYEQENFEVEGQEEIKRKRKNLEQLTDNNTDVSTKEKKNRSKNYGENEEVSLEETCIKKKKKRENYDDLQETKNAGVEEIQTKKKKRKKDKKEIIDLQTHDTTKKSENFDELQKTVILEDNKITKKKKRNKELISEEIIDLQTGDTSKKIKNLEELQETDKKDVEFLEENEIKKKKKKRNYNEIEELIPEETHDATKKIKNSELQETDEKDVEFLEDNKIKKKKKKRNYNEIEETHDTTKKIKNSDELQEKEKKDEKLLEDNKIKKKKKKRHDKENRQSL